MTGATCPFCDPPEGRRFHDGRLVVGLWDQFPVSPGHALLIPRRHVATWFDATAEERSELTAAIEAVRIAIEREHRPDGYNIGINLGEAAGQTIFHLHVHVIPRYWGQGHDALRAWYEDFRQRHGVRPRAVEAFHEGYTLRAVRRSHGSWLGFVRHMGDLGPSVIAGESGPGKASQASQFLDELETTPMSRSYKMVVLLAMLNEGRLPGAIDVLDLSRAVARLASRSSKLRADFAVALDDLG